MQSVSESGFEKKQWVWSIRWEGRMNKNKNKKDQEWRTKFKNKRKCKKLKMVDSIIDMGNLKLNPLLRKGWFPRGF